MFFDPKFDPRIYCWLTADRSDFSFIFLLVWQTQSRAFEGGRWNQYSVSHNITSQVFCVISDRDDRRSQSICSEKLLPPWSERNGGVCGGGWRYEDGKMEWKDIGEEDGDDDDDDDEMRMKKKKRTWRQWKSHTEMCLPLEMELNRENKKMMKVGRLPC